MATLVLQLVLKKPFQIHLRLQEIKTSPALFGGVSVIICGDLMQLRPTMANFVFAEPRNEQFKLYHKIAPLFEEFKVRNLVTNFRQGNDKEYAQMMERLRFGIQSQEDIEKLLSRVILPNNPIAKEALNIFGKNASVEEHNLQKLSDLPNALFKIKTKNNPPPGMENYKTQVHIITIKITS